MPDMTERRLAFVQAGWHAEILDGGRAAFVETLAAHGIAADRVDLVDVPGSFELPLHARRLASTGRYAAVVAAGLVIDGGIYRHEFVASAVIDGLMRVQLDTDVPVLSMVLTPHHFHEHGEHTSFFTSHLRLKGAEVARACLQTIDSLAAIPA